MLFNSYVFIFVFLPASLLLFHGFRQAGLPRAALLILTLLSLFFYAWWNPAWLWLLVSLIALDFLVATAIARTRRGAARVAKALLVSGIAVNLCVLGYFKYANFLLENINAVLHRESTLAQVFMPLGISFFTFQKIAFLSDVYQGKVERFTLLDYALFVVFFPQLIAGPIVHHREMLPQFERGTRPSPLLAAMGVTIFTIGLGKKVLLADTVGTFVAQPFDAAAQGASVGLIDGWSGALAYTAQLYFDFSGYSDMAIGVALLFGIRLPVNFASPYKATSIVDFWRRWHVTLSRFLRDYVYVPLGGGRGGPVRRFVNLAATMLLGGLWHGAGWTFVAWGGLHAAYLIAAHGWRSLVGTGRAVGSPLGMAGRAVAFSLTFLAVVVGWVLFRAPDLGAASAMLRGMAGLNGTISVAGSDAATGLLVAAGLLVLGLLAPNTQDLTGYTGPEGDVPEIPRHYWRPTFLWGVATGAAFAAVVMSLSDVSEFLYFQF